MALHGIALSQTRAGDIPGSLATASVIGSEVSRAKAYKEIAAAQTQRGDMEKARLWINKLASPIEKTSALLGVANGLLEKGGVPPDASCEKIHMVNPRSN